ncbi:NAD-dependent epimerase/dehydratase family protein [Cryobacterium sp. TMT1-3]|uniref:NAD-dependent epimerase/dehydratase family protein n=1 Tax=Cryobacterium sp. TMT1-3 TaxID=1259237 RepID=UPI00106A1CCB|nr:NAD-dependent epimerase/dehydratase family protein [Cryobacterium sp. TMT1-3]TFC27279.1 NAD-dependent epimerase/dehydratase family protein [Cryobacterium sp. TMT1-3]
MTGELLLVTGGAGFIGSAIVDAALARGYRVRVLDSLRADVHGPAPERQTDADADADAGSGAGPGSDIESVPGPGPETGPTINHGPTFRARARTAPARLDPRVEFVHGDVTDPATVARALDGIDVVCHQAAKVGLGVDFADAPDYVHSNEVGTAVLLAAMAERGIRRLVLASSMVVYGEGSYRGPNGFTRPGPRRASDLDAKRFDPLDPVTGRPLEPVLVSETDPLDPRNVYASSKLGQEYLATAWARSTGGRVAALRYHNVYGPGMPQNTPYAGVASLFRSAIERGEAPRVYEDGRQRRDFVHVRDVAAANIAALEFTAFDWVSRAAVTTTDVAGQAVPATDSTVSPRPAPADEASSRPPTVHSDSGIFRPFNVGSGIVHTIGDMATALAAASGGLAPIVTGQYRLGDVRHITASSERLRTELGWAAQVSFDDGMREFATAPLRAAVLP